MLGLITFGIIIGGIIYFIAEKIESAKGRIIFFAANYFAVICIGLSGFFISMGLGLNIALPPGGGAMPLGFILSTITWVLGFGWGVIVTCVVIIRLIVSVLRKRSQH